MKERPILMNAFSVRAILDGKKIQTRRVMKPQPEHIENGMYKWRKWLPWLPQDAHLLVEHCPYGVPGDRLWVRETWFPMQDAEACALANEPVDVAYKADYDAEGISREEARDIGIDRWRPFIFMPRWASRITLEITDIRVERVQDIQGHDLVREGVGQGGLADDFAEDHKRFRALWDSINAKKGFSFDANPWIWVIEFDRLEKGAKRERD